MEFTIAGLVEATATVVPERPAIIGDQGTLSYPELVDRSRRLARFLGDHGLGAYRERDALRGHETGLLAGDLVELLGRDSRTINTGGEKVFAEEVEAAVRTHPDVADAVVGGHPLAHRGPGHRR